MQRRRSWRSCWLLPALDRETAVVVNLATRATRWRPTSSSVARRRCSTTRRWRASWRAWPGHRAARPIQISCGGAAALADLEAYALGMEGNALRVAGSLRDALMAFMQAREVQEKGGADPDLAARIDLMEASLRRDIRQFGAALTPPRSRGGDVRLSARQRADGPRDDQPCQCLPVQRDLDRAIANLRKALPLVQDPGSPLHPPQPDFALPSLRRGPRGGGSLRAVAEPLPAFLRSADQQPPPVGRGPDRPRARRSRAGHPALLSEAAERLAEQGYGFDAALAGLDLVAVYAKQGQADEVLRVASHLLPALPGRTTSSRRPSPH